MIKRFFLNDGAIALLVTVNSAIIFLSGFGLGDAPGFYLSLLDSLISLMFVVEVAVKIRAYGVKKYFKVAWNVMDFILVAISVPSAISFFFGTDMVDIGYLLVLRSLRIFKVVRFFRFIPNVNKLISGFKNAMKSSVLVLATFTLYMFVMGVVSSSLFGTKSAMFADPAVSMYTVLKVFTLEGWYDIPEQLLTGGASAGMTFFVRAYFVFILLTGGVFGLSLVNSVFVDAMVSDNNEELEAKVDRLSEKIDRLIEKGNGNNVTKKRKK